MRKWLKKYDVLAKALSIVIAAVLWFYVVNVVDPETEVEIRDIQPTYIGSEELLNSKNIMVSNADTNLVSITLSGKRQELASISKNDIHVEVDISKIKEAGTYKLPYNVKLPVDSVKVSRRQPFQLELRMDKIVTATVPLRVKLEGRIAEGYMAEEIATTPNALSITGLQNEVAKISYAQVKITKRDINTSILEQIGYDFYDTNDKTLNLKSIQSENETVEVSVPILKLKDLPLSAEIVEGGGALKKHVKVDIDPKFITVAGEPKTIDALQSIMIGVVELSKIQDATTIPFQISLPDNLKNISGEKTANVDVSIRGLIKKQITTTSVEVINIPAGYTIEPVTNRIDVIIRGAEGSMAKILPQNVRAVVDLASTVLTPGQHTIPAAIVIDGFKDIGAIGEYKVVVKVSQ